MTFAPTFFAKKDAAPGFGCRMTTRSTFMERILFTVSTRDSPFLTELPDALKFTMSADSLFSASSKDNLVRVEFSKNKLAMVISLKDGTFFMGRLITSLKLSAVLNIKLMSSVDSSLIPIRCSTLKLFIIFFTIQYYFILSFNFCPLY